MTRCAGCAGREGHLLQLKADLGRAARRCARDDTPRNRALVATAKAEVERSRHHLPDVCTHQKETR